MHTLTKCSVAMLYDLKNGIINPKPISQTPNQSPNTFNNAYGDKNYLFHLFQIIFIHG